MNKINTNISLTSQEIEIFRLLTEFCIQKNLGTQLRVAGGWVRDKVLGKESHDIDITLDNMTGEHFLNLSHDYLKQNSQASGFGVTKINQEKSKHLETARVKINEMWIDLVNLRGETYEQDSRIPQITIGTPEQDALRRDFTTNALFYNLMTGQIEDFTQRGLEDLKNGIIRTPLNPEITFRDDPLRILRSIRFASRFQFQIQEDIIKCLQNEEILVHLKQKVTKERIGIEVGLVLQHPTVFLGLSYYYNFKLFPIIFEIPQISDSSNQLVLFEQSFKNIQICNQMINNVDFSFSVNYFDSIQIQYYSYLAVILMPFRNVQIEKNKISQTTSGYIVRESLKFSNKDQITIQTIEGFYNDVVSIYENMNLRQLIMFLKKAKSLWELVLFITNINLIGESKINDMSLFNNIKQLIIENQFQEVHNLKLPGKDIQQIFNQTKTGPYIQQVLDEVFISYALNRNFNQQDLVLQIQKLKDKFQID